MMNKQNVLKQIIPIAAALVLSGGMQMRADAAQTPFSVSIDTDSLRIGPAPSYNTGEAFDFGEISETGVFVNRWADYRLQIPEGFSCTAGGNQYHAVFYTPEDAVRDLGSAIDAALISEELTDEMPDPEMPEDNAMILLSFFRNVSETEGAPDAAQYARALIMNAVRNPKLADYITERERVIGGKIYQSYSIDYTKALQSYYRAQLGDGKEHPVFDEQFSFLIEVCARQIGGKYHFLYTLKSGSYYQSAVDLIGCIS